jgi:hypothetical protein
VRIGKGCAVDRQDLPVLEEKSGYRKRRDTEKSINHNRGDAEARKMEADDFFFSPRLRVSALNKNPVFSVCSVFSVVNSGREGAGPPWHLL